MSLILALHEKFSLNDLLLARAWILGVVYGVSETRPLPFIWLDVADEWEAHALWVSYRQRQLLPIWCHLYLPARLAHKFKMVCGSSKSCWVLLWFKVKCLFLALIHLLPWAIPSHPPVSWLPTALQQWMLQPEGWRRRFIVVVGNVQLPGQADR